VGVEQENPRDLPKLKLRCQGCNRGGYRDGLSIKNSSLDISAHLIIIKDGLKLCHTL
ncbi:hypothetical protein LEMLEM_LOCUS9823, partial [Lemmus lemmus]